jgi:hypothetical protein
MRNSNRLIILLIAAVALVALFAPQAASAAPPSVITESATEITGTTAQLNGVVFPEGNPTSYWFEYGTTTSYGTKIPLTPQEVGSGFVVVVKQTPTGLTQNTTYHFRLVAQSSGGTTNGKDKTFTTLKPPKITAVSSSNVFATQATLKGNVNPEGTATSYWFEYGTTKSYGTKIPVTPEGIGSGTSSVPVSRTPTGLTQNTTYHFRLVAQSAGGTVNSGDLGFTTLKLPRVTTEAATEIKTTAAKLNGTVNPEGSSTSYWFEYGKTTEYGTKVPLFTEKNVGSGTSDVAVSEAISGLTKSTTYHFRLVAQSATGTNYGADVQFSTAKPPKAVTGAATEVTATEATLNATVNPEGWSTNCAFGYGLTTSYGSIKFYEESIGGTSNVPISVRATGLTPNTTYHYMVICANEGGSSNGEDKTFTTSP